MSRDFQKKIKMFSYFFNFNILVMFLLYYNSAYLYKITHRNSEVRGLGENKALYWLDYPRNISQFFIPHGWQKYCNRVIIKVEVKNGKDKQSWDSGRRQNRSGGSYKAGIQREAEGVGVCVQVQVRERV